MKKVLLIVIILTLTIVLSGCENTKGEIQTKTECDYEYKAKTQVVEKTDDGYIVAKDKMYTQYNLYKLHTEQKLDINETLYVVVYEDGTAKMYSEVDCD